MPAVSLEQLLASGAHFGHLTRRWNPKMKKFIFMQKNGIHIIDLKKTQSSLEIALKALSQVVAEGYDILFVGTKVQAKEIINSEASRCEQFFVTHRWLGGMLTNFATIKKSIKHYKNLDKMSKDGTYEKISKKERLTIDRDKEKLNRVLCGIEDMKRLPGAIFIVDTKKEHIALKEAVNMRIPVFAMVDTNCDPTLIDYPVPANDDAAKSISLIIGKVADTILEVKQKTQQEKAIKEAADNEKKQLEEKPVKKEQKQIKKPNKES